MQDIQKAVITAAGLGTRLLPATKVMPKEMFPVCLPERNGRFVIKPMIQIIYESLFSFGIRNYCVIVGRGKRSIEDHFTIERSLLRDLEHSGKMEIASRMNELFKKISSTIFVYVNQPEPTGFGDAILKSRHYVANDDFILHAGDDIIISKKNDHLTRLVSAFKRYDADAACLITEVDSPEKYGVVTGKELDADVILVESMEEKPRKPKSKLAIIAIYAFKSEIFTYLEKAKGRVHPEKELEYMLKTLVKNKKFLGVKLKKGESRLDIGNPESYLSTIELLSNLPPG